MSPHVPSAPLPFFAAVQAWQGPAHAVSQQKASTQNPSAHSADELHGAPAAFLIVQAFPAQYAPATQSAPVEHDAPQVVALVQRYGLQAVLVAVHVPAPSQYDPAS
jgi:hypothetical protein